MKSSASLKKNTENLKKLLNSDDVKFKEIKIGKSAGIIVFAADLTDKSAIGELILRPALKIRSKPTKRALDNILLSPETERANDLIEVAEWIRYTFSR